VATAAPAPAPTPPPGPELRLRSQGASLDGAGVVASLAKAGFAVPDPPNGANLQSLHKSSKARDVRTKTAAGAQVVVDATTGLMWQATGSYAHSKSGLVKAGEVAAYGRDLNAKKHAGFSDWRVPTLEELASVVARDKGDARWALVPGFDLGAPWFTLTTDKVKGDPSVIWTIDVGAGDVQQYSSTDEYYVLLVRSMP